MDWDTVYRIGTFAALLLGFYNFYLQRRDQKEVLDEFQKLTPDDVVWSRSPAAKNE